MSNSYKKFKIFIKKSLQNQIKAINFVSETKTNKNMKAKKKIIGSKKLERAMEIWYQKLTPIQRIEIAKMFWRNSVSKTFMACLYYIAENIEKYE
jgi:tRNA A37 threonylcarbamoyladenosine dehydratase